MQLPLSLSKSRAGSKSETAAAPEKGGRTKGAAARDAFSCGCDGGECGDIRYISVSETVVACRKQDKPRIVRTDSLGVLHESVSPFQQMFILVYGCSWMFMDVC